MKALVLGGGAIGVTAACHLAKGGHDVTVVDRKEMPCERDDGLGERFRRAL